MQPFDSENLTEPESNTERLLKLRDCRTCLHGRVKERGGAWVCVVPETPDPVDVVAGWIQCEFYE
jgi:hypothetical protein